MKEEAKAVEARKEAMKVLQARLGEFAPWNQKSLSFAASGQPMDKGRAAPEAEQPEDSENDEQPSDEEGPAPVGSEENHVDAVESEGETPPLDLRGNPISSDDDSALLNRIELRMMTLVHKHKRVHSLVSGEESLAKVRRKNIEIFASFSATF